MNGFVLPSKLSEVIILSLDCVEEIEADELYIMSMSTWHSPVNSDDRKDHRFVSKTLGQGKSPSKVQCKVCTAGAIMAKRFSVAPSMRCFPSMFDDHTDGMMTALDKIKDGLLYSACEIIDATDLQQAELVDLLTEGLGIEFNQDGGHFNTTRYFRDPVGIKQQLCIMAGAFREVGL